MLTFFRKIRKSLTDKSSARKYLLYSVGEIILVVIGILIALQVNNWNENRKDKDRLNHHLLELTNELDTDKENLGQLIERVRKLNEQTTIISEYLNADISQWDTLSFKVALLDAETYAFFSISNATYTSLVSSGDIQLIGNTQLKRLLSVYYNNSNWDWTAHNGNLKLVIEKYSSYIHKFLPPLMFRDRYINYFRNQLDDEQFSKYQASGGGQINWNSLKTDEEFKMIVSQLLTYRVFHLFFYKKLNDDIDEIKSLIQAELMK